jgi:hypothetical protein
MAGVLLLALARDFSLIYSILTGFRAHPASYPTGIILHNFSLVCQNDFVKISLLETEHKLSEGDCVRFWTLLIVLVFRTEENVSETASVSKLR